MGQKKEREKGRPNDRGSERETERKRGRKEEQGDGEIDILVRNMRQKQEREGDTRRVGERERQCDRWRSRDM
jgi:hypothetical protein